MKTLVFFKLATKAFIYRYLFIFILLYLLYLLYCIIFIIMYIFSGCTHKIKCRIAMAKTTFNMKTNLFTSKDNTYIITSPTRFV